MSASTALLLQAACARLGIEPRRLRELGVAAAIVALVAWLTPSVPYSYPTYAGAFIAFGLLLYVIENQERTLYLLLWFSTIYLMLKATLLAWSGLAFLFKEGFLALLVGFWLFHLVIRNERLRPTPLNKPVFLLMGWLVLEMFNPNVNGFFTAIDDFRFLIGPLAVFFLTVHLVDDRTKLERAIKVVFIYALIEAVYGVAQQWMPGDLLVRLGADPESYFYFYQGAIRSFSTMGTAGFAMFASMFPPIAFFYMSQQRDPFRRWVLLGCGFVFVLGVLFTLVRTGWVAVGLSVVLYAIATRRVQVLVVIVVMVALVVVFASGFMKAKVEGIQNYDEDASVQTRLQIWGVLWKGIVFRVFGFGLGTFAKNRFGYSMGGREEIGTSTENWYLMTSLELGWVGILLIGWIWVNAYRIGWRGYKGTLKTRRYRELSIALLGSLLAIDVARMGGPAGYFPPDSWHYWFFLGLLMALPKADEELAAEEAAAALGDAAPARRASGRQPARAAPASTVPAPAG